MKWEICQKTHLKCSSLHKKNTHYKYTLTLSIPLLFIYYIVHPSILYTRLSCLGSRGAGACPSGHRTWSRVQPRLVLSPSEGHSTVYFNSKSKNFYSLFNFQCVQSTDPQRQWKTHICSVIISESTPEIPSDILINIHWQGAASMSIFIRITVFLSHFYGKLSFVLKTTS